jgi:hypothetical protein
MFGVSTFQIFKMNDLFQGLVDHKQGTLNPKPFQSLFKQLFAFGCDNKSSN